MACVGLRKSHSSSEPAQACTGSSLACRFCRYRLHICLSMLRVRHGDFLCVTHTRGRITNKLPKWVFRVRADGVSLSSRKQPAGVLGTVAIGPQALTSADYIIVVTVVVVQR